MVDKLIVSADETVTCPKCRQTFELADGLARQTIDAYQDEFKEELRRGAEEQRRRVADEERQRADERTRAELDRLTTLIETKEVLVEDLKGEIKKAREAGEKTAEERLGEEQERLRRDLARQAEKLKEYQKLELSLREEKRKLEPATRHLY